MIRFWAGDLSVWVNDPRPCGRTYPRLPKGIYGRADDMFVVRGENVYPSAVEDVIRGIKGFGDKYRILFFDGVVLKQKGAAKVQKRIILCVYGITWEGKKEMIDFLLATSESQNAWEGFLRDLFDETLP